eukprot:TRINITY_DN13759_c0_g1_i1.p1 TRINITY_DN13759_c0_g1~~TRINITY_DN13759_c0_g1_i1.p1  ORF type:complete len:383 (-),score=85.73 TRINITY_DN13759_c0_g1_i1:118-1182(-)
MTKVKAADGKSVTTVELQFFVQQQSVTLQQAAVGMDALLICLDRSGVKYDVVSHWMTKFVRFLEGDIKKFLIETKNDLDYILPKEATHYYSRFYKLPCYSTSAKTGDGVRNCFQCIAQSLVNEENTVIQEIPITLISMEQPKLVNNPLKPEEIEIKREYLLIPEDVVYKITQYLDTITVLKFSLTCKKMLGIWKFKKDVDLSKGAWSYSYILKIFNYLQEQSNLHFSILPKNDGVSDIAKMIKDSVTSKIRISISCPEVGGLNYSLFHLQSNIPFPSIVELHFVLSFFQLCYFTHLFPSLKKFSSNHSWVGQILLTVPINIEYLYAPFENATYGYMTNLKTLKIDLSQSTKEGF